MDINLTAEARDFLMKRFRRTVAVLFDERSMVSLNTYGEAARNIAITAHSGRHGEETLGGIPIMIILGDDCQLPPQIEKGAFDIISGNNNRSGK